VVGFCENYSLTSCVTVALEETSCTMESVKRLEIFTVMKVQVVFWVMILCSDVVG
jgi:hypothetical protein